MRILGIDNRICFGRRPKPSEEAGLRYTINRAYYEMGTKDRVVITHGSCFPALNQDTYIGSPYGKAAQEYINFLMLYGFNGNQLGPGGELSMDENGIIPSPYNSSAFSKNRLFIDLEALTTEKYGNILSQDTFFAITRSPENTDKNYVHTNFREAEKVYDYALEEAYDNFASGNTPQIAKLKNEYIKFLAPNNERLTDEGVFKVLAKKYGTDNFEEWDNPVDKDLIRLKQKGNHEAIERFSQILTKNKKDIQVYKFSQFIATKQIKENKKWRDNIGFKYISDLLVGCSKMDHWRCRDAFIDGYQLGAPEGSKKNPQVWNIPVLNPRQLFTKDGLGPAGQFLKDKIDYALEFCENLRIDHVMGLIEPFVIENESLIFDNEKNLINHPATTPVQGKYISQMRANGKALDDYKNYSCEYVHGNGKTTYHSNIMNKIVLPTLKEHGIDPDDAIWEDLCSQPEAFRKVFYDDLKLPGITQTEYTKAQEGPENNWYLVGSHDSIPAYKMIKRDWTRRNDAWNPMYLAGYLNMDSTRASERDDFCEKISSDDKELIKAKFAELMTKDKFEISFADLLGITETVYNLGGTKNNTNWKERIPAQYIDQYYENLSSENPTAINIPEVLKIALQAKIDMEIAKSDRPNQVRFEIHERYKPLLDSLQKYADILKEPE